MGNEQQSYLYNRYQYIIENIKDVVWEINEDFVFTFVSPNIIDMTGHRPEELIGCKMHDFLADESRNYVAGQVSKYVNKRLEGYVEGMVLMSVQFICKNGLPKWVEVSANPMFREGKFAGYIGTTRDITEKKEYESKLNKYVDDLKRMNAELEKMAAVDALTGAFNRRKFNDDLDSIIKKKAKYGISISLVLFDIDNFKAINDCFGHKAGDNVLQSIAGLVMDNLASTDGLFRWGGDEFIIILPEADLKSAEDMAEKIRNIIQNHDFGVGQGTTISLAVGEYEPDENTDQIIARIDNALLKAKSNGKNKVVAC